MKPIDVLSEVCRQLSKLSPESSLILQQHYPHVTRGVHPTGLKRPVAKKLYCSPLQSTLVFIKDGFVDRYSGDPVVFPPVLRVISLAHPKEFPFHPRWKTGAIHQAYWELYPEVDHHVAQAAGGTNDPSNWFTTSAAHNSEKLHKPFADLGWKIHNPGNIRQWDGLLGWFVQYAAARPEILQLNNVHRWHAAAVSKQVQTALKSAL